ncbi:MAG: hypothetical protein N4P87_00555 [Candidatus Lightella neohaematopini]|nr:hypothetical protein [Candidatus Lightella neohaematopini]
MNRIMLRLGVNKKKELCDISNLIVFLQLITTPNSFYDLVKKYQNFVKY